MNARKLLDEVFKPMQALKPNATLSDTNAAYIEALTVLETALLNEYSKGRNEALEEIRKKNTEKQKNQN